MCICAASRASPNKTFGIFWPSEVSEAHKAPRLPMQFLDCLEQLTGVSLSKLSLRSV